MKFEPGFFFPAGAKLVSEQQGGSLVLEGLAVDGTVSAPSHRAAPESCCLSFLVNRAKDQAVMLQPSGWGEGTF